MGSSVSANAVRSSHVLATQIVMTISDSDWEAFKQYMASMPPDARRQVEQRYADEADALYNSFKASFMKGLCDTCGKPLTSFTPGAPCFHWLLRPKGCKKSHIAEVFQSKGYFRTASYIRWVCNQAVHIARINDLSEEGDKEAIFHWSWHAPQKLYHCVLEGIRYFMPYVDMSVFKKGCPYEKEITHA